MGCAREISAPKANLGFEKQRSGYAKLNMIVSLLPEPCVQTGDRAKNERGTGRLSRWITCPRVV